MGDTMAKGLSLVDVSGFMIIGAILALLAAGVLLTFWLRRRYARLGEDVARQGHGAAGFEEPVLQRIAQKALDAQRRSAGDVNTQAIIEDEFSSGLALALTLERFLKSSTGLMIILGLVGTFYGLTLSIGKLVGLLSGDHLTDVADLTEGLTRGLTEALSGMSVAFSTSLVGIVSAIVMTLLGVFLNVSDRRAAVMTQIEAYIDNVLLGAERAQGGAGAVAGQGGGFSSDARIEQMVANFGQTVGRLEGVVQAFEGALTKFATSTRDFQEFNLHLKDNIQRMSLSFGDLSEALKREAHRSRERV